MIPIWYSVCLALACAYFGFWYGRSRNWGLLAQEQALGREEAEGAEQKKSHRRQSGASEPPHHENTRRILPHVRYLASPTGGSVEKYPVGENQGVRITTTESKMYSPSSGRVLWIAPRGNAFLIMTDWGDEVEVRACDSEDDLLDRYFRPRVVRGEIIRRGKLLLEYDRERLNRECGDTAVYLTARGEENGSLEFAQETEVKVGDALFWVN